MSRSIIHEVSEVIIIPFLFSLLLIVLLVIILVFISGRVVSVCLPGSRGYGRVLLVLLIKYFWHLLRFLNSDIGFSLVCLTVHSTHLQRLLEASVDTRLHLERKINERCLFLC